MATESTEAARLLAEGEPATDLIEALDELLATTRRERTPLDQFYAELGRIHGEVRHRLGLPIPTQLLGSIEVPQSLDLIDDGSPEEDAYDIWCVVRTLAENKPRGRTLSNEEFWAEFEDEIEEYETASRLESAGG